MSRGSKVLVGFLVLLLAGAGVAYGLDRYTRAQTEARIEQELSGTFPEVSGDVQVTIGGLLFLPQLIAGTLQDVRLTADGATYNALTVSDVVVHATGLSTQAPYTARTIELTATAPVETLRAALESSDLPDGVTIDVRDGHLVAGASFLDLPIEVTLVPEARPRAIGLTLTSFSLAGVEVSADALPGTLLEALGATEIAADELPAGMELTDVEVVDGGVRLQVRGTDVILEAPT